MPNSTVQAAGEATPIKAYSSNWQKAKSLGKELSEVLEQLGDTEFAFIRPASNEFAVAFGGNPHSAPDPVIAAVQAYRDGTKAFEAIGSVNFDQHGGQDAVIEKTYGPPMRVLDAWEAPCTSREGAVAALRHALEECEAFSCSDSLTAMTRAALLYLEGTRL